MVVLGYILPLDISQQSGRWLFLFPFPGAGLHQGSAASGGVNGYDSGHAVLSARLLRLLGGVEAHALPGSQFAMAEHAVNRRIG